MKTAMGPTILIVLGVLFLLSEFHVAGFGHTWPLILITIGLVKFGQSAAPTTDHVNPPVGPVPPVPQYGVPGATYTEQQYSAPATPPESQRPPDEGQVSHV
jgi:hypothetical protein